MTLLREPLLHFAVAGGILFGGYSWLNDRHSEATTSEQISLGEGDVRWLKQTWSTQWLREPTADELKGLVDDLLNEKVMAREAQEMGLEKDDTIIRRRLAQKLKFLVEDTAQLVQPTEVELRQFYAANPAHFETPGTLSFRQVYFNPEHRKDAAAEATAALGAFAAKVGDDSIEGDRLLFGDSFADTDEQALSGMFGADFARQVFAFEPGGWRGPVKSGYGFHLVLVTQRTATAPKPFETVKDAVLADWRSAKQTELSRNYMVELRNKYDAALDASAKALLGQENTPKVAAQ
ncbi:hypothetical protein X727_08145 [Mesorhizobium sp. L103C119B0]|nr:hypothetical protein X727_08145 [Mesorhizobium sp. L103C119B0]